MSAQDLKVYHAQYRERASYGYHKDIDCIVVAEDIEDAKNRLASLYSSDKLDMSRWTLEPISTKEVGVHYISSSES